MLLRDAVPLDLHPLGIIQGQQRSRQPLRRRGRGVVSKSSRPPRGLDTISRCLAVLAVPPRIIAFRRSSTRAAGVEGQGAGQMEVWGSVGARGSFYAEDCRRKRSLGALGRIPSASLVCSAGAHVNRPRERPAALSSRSWWWRMAVHSLVPLSLMCWEIF